MAASGGASAACRRCGWACFTTDVALDAAWDMVKDWTAEERQAMRDSVGKLGFQTPFRNTTVQELAHRMLEISGGRASNAAPSWTARGMSEEGFLNPLRELVARG